MSTKVVLIAGVPRAGKSSLCDLIEGSDVGFTHVPLDRYIKPIPVGMTFLEWVRCSDCIAWDHLFEHLRILESGTPCYTPRPDWVGGRGEWRSAGGPIEDAPGRLMQPPDVGYLLPGTHAFAFQSGDFLCARVFVEVPDSVVASRLCGNEDEREPAVIVREHLGTNPEVIRPQAQSADLILQGVGDRSKQMAVLLEFLQGFYGGETGAELGAR